MVQYPYHTQCDLGKNASHTMPLPWLKDSKGFPLSRDQMLHLQGPAWSSPTLAQTLDHAPALLPSFRSSVGAPSQAQRPRTCCCQAWNAIPLHEPMPLLLAQTRRLFSSKPPSQIITLNSPVDLAPVGPLSGALRSLASRTGALSFILSAARVAELVPSTRDCMGC